MVPSTSIRSIVGVAAEAPEAANAATTNTAAMNVAGKRVDTVDLLFALSFFPLTRFLSSRDRVHPPLLLLLKERYET